MSPRRPATDEANEPVKDTEAKTPARRSAKAAEAPAAKRPTTGKAATKKAEPKAATKKAEPKATKKAEPKAATKKAEPKPKAAASSAAEEPTEKPAERASRKSTGATPARGKKAPAEGKRTAPPAAESEPSTGAEPPAAEAEPAASAAPAPRGRARSAATPRGNGASPGKYSKPTYYGLRARYQDEIVPALQRQFSYANAMQIPKVEKVVVNIGLGEAIQNAKALDAAVGDLAIITGQKAIVTRAKRSIAQFRVRTGMPIGAKVTLRGQRMYDFLERTFNLALPRIRDFRGIPTRSFDGRGNFSLGLREQLVFPEIDYDKIDRLRGLEISIITTARTDEEGLRLLQLLGMPFQSA